MTSAASRLAGLQGYLERDPTNLALLADTASTAFEGGDLDTADRSIERYGALAALPPDLQNLKGLVALHRQDFVRAVAAFEPLVEADPANASLAFNLAWSRMMLGEHESALDALTALSEPLSVSAATLRIDLLHRLGRLDDALMLGATYAARSPDDRRLMSALALVAMDASQPALARDYALHAGDSAAALSTLGALDLTEGRVAEAAHLFKRALADSADSARAHLGMGLCLLINKDAQAGSKQLDQAASLFGKHLGSWVAAGWAHLLSGELTASRSRFETALALDDTFAESHGGLAVLDIIEGQTERGRRGADVARRLDRNCFGAALARVLLAQREGDQRSVDRIWAIALNTPISSDGRTLGSAIASLVSRG